MRRRSFFDASVKLLLSGSLLADAARADSAEESAHGFRTFTPQSFGAKATGETMDGPAIQQAVDACAKAGGGIVYLAPGAYLTGTVILKSNVTLYLEAGATLRGSPRIEDYPPQSGDRVNPQGDANDKHLIFARDAVNVGLAGRGRIDGQGPAFWFKNDRRYHPPELEWTDVATWYLGHGPRPGPLLEFVGVKGLYINDVTIENAASWTLRPLACDDVFIRGITIRNPRNGPNTDGIDPTGCRNLLIADCNITTGDDAICLKSENQYGLQRVSKNIVITNCVIDTNCNGFKIGTASFDGFENITLSNCVFYSRGTRLREHMISALAIETVDGGYIDGLTATNLVMQTVRTPIFVRLGNRRGQGTLRNVAISDVRATGSICTSSVTGLPGHPVRNVSLSNIFIGSDEGGEEAWADREIPEKPDSYPEARMFGRLPASGLYVRHVHGIRLRNYRLESSKPDYRPLLVCDDVEDLDVDGLSANASQGRQPVVRLSNVRGAFFRGCSAPRGAGPFLYVDGEQTRDVTLIGNDLGSARTPCEGARADAVFAASNRPPQG